MLLDHETPNIDLINCSSLIFPINMTPELARVDTNKESGLTGMSLPIGVRSQLFSSEEASEEVTI